MKAINEQLGPKLTVSPTLLTESNTNHSTDATLRVNAEKSTPLVGFVSAGSVPAGRRRIVPAGFSTLPRVTPKTPLKKVTPNKTTTQKVPKYTDVKTNIQTKSDNGVNKNQPTAKTNRKKPLPSAPVKLKTEKQKRLELIYDTSSNRWDVKPATDTNILIDDVPNDVVRNDASDYVPNDVSDVNLNDNKPFSRLLNAVKTVNCCPCRCPPLPAAICQPDSSLCSNSFTKFREAVRAVQTWITLKISELKQFMSNSCGVERQQ